MDVKKVYDEVLKTAEAHDMRIDKVCEYPSYYYLPLYGKNVPSNVGGGFGAYIDKKTGNIAYDGPGSQKYSERIIRDMTVDEFLKNLRAA